MINPIRVYHTYPNYIRILDPNDRDKLMRLIHENGIEVETFTSDNVLEGMASKYNTESLTDLIKVTKF